MAHRTLSLFSILAFLCICTIAKDVGRLECSEKDGLKPDSKLLNLIISKCQPKSGQKEEIVAACLIKCLMKQHKAVDKKGKMKVKVASEVVNMFPEKFKDNITEQFNTCFEKHNGDLEKESNGCLTWVNFTTCFYGFGKNLCPSEKDRLRWATSTVLPTTSEEASTTS